MDTTSFLEYAKFYDIYYEAKDYSAEVNFILELSEQFGLKPQSILDMGCGTGKHLIEFHKRGLKCDGFDLSDEMLLQARERLSGLDVTLEKGDLTKYRNGKKYDLVVSMFAVMGYLIENSQLIAGLKTAKAHMTSDSLFIFDSWFGPAVLAQKPEERTHTYQDGKYTINRDVKPFLDPVGQRVEVRYKITVENDSKILKRIEESHLMRYMFVQEMALAMELSGLELVYYCPFLDSTRELDLSTWNVTFVAKARGGV